MKETAGQKIRRLEQERDDAVTRASEPFKNMIDQRRTIKKLEGQVAALLRVLKNVEKSTTDPETAKYARRVLAGGEVDGG
ncbi:hypothetical protein [Paenibacillus sp. RUD330]|uniref:hypothetical protein n=1 Tax=Paenibacillus sp. RUD330 TaxID=2023772 RepID=UPI000B92DDE7|nr:hypothetical protein [Paenibacillus sp. RUD330]ASS64719.1 hypothetical protein CIC07_00290 [Paenibacillus sp. RUD330]